MNHRTILSTVLLIGACSFMTACSTFDTTTGQREFDQVKTDKTKAVLKNAISGAIGAMELDEDVQRYLNYSANTICEMRDTGEFSPAVLARNLDKGLTDEGLVGNQWAILTKTTILALYEINYADRGTADLPQEQFLWNMMDVMCEAIRQGLRDKGFPVDVTYKVEEIQETQQLALNL